MISNNVEQTRLLGLTVEDVKTINLEELDLLIDNIRIQLERNWMNIEHGLEEMEKRRQ